MNIDIRQADLYQSNYWQSMNQWVLEGEAIGLIIRNFQCIFILLCSATEFFQNLRYWFNLYKVITSTVIKLIFDGILKIVYIVSDFTRYFVSFAQNKHLNFLGHILWQRLRNFFFLRDKISKFKPTRFLFMFSKCSRMSVKFWIFISVR